MSLFVLPVSINACLELRNILPQQIDVNDALFELPPIKASLHKKEIYLGLPILQEFKADSYRIIFGHQEIRQMENNTNLKALVIPSNANEVDLLSYYLKSVFASSNFFLIAEVCSKFVENYPSIVIEAFKNQYKNEDALTGFRFYQKNRSNLLDLCGEGLSYHDIKLLSAQKHNLLELIFEYFLGFQIIGNTLKKFVYLVDNLYRRDKKLLVEILDLAKIKALESGNSSNEVKNIFELELKNAVSPQVQNYRKTMSESAVALKKKYEIEIKYDINCESDTLICSFPFKNFEEMNRITKNLKKMSDDELLNCMLNQLS